MRKLILALIIVMLMATMSWAEGTVTVKRGTINDGIETITFSWIANAASAATVPATSSDGEWPKYKGGCVALVVTNPGSPAPTDNYDITITDPSGVDIMGGELANRDTANSEQVVPKINTSFGCRITEGPITLNITNNSVNSAEGVVIVYIIN